jgi:hypothetical protein
MATQNYPDVGTLEQASKYRTGVPTRLLNVLTGGLAGAITGSTEKAQEAARARQALLQEDLDKRTEQRMIERMKLQQAEMLKRQLELENARTDSENRRRLLETAGTEEALTGKYITGPVEQSQELGRQIGRLQKLSVDQKEAAEKAGLIGQLTAEMGPTERAAVEAGVVSPYESMDIASLRRIKGAYDVSLRKQEEARRAKQDEGKVFVSRNAAGDVSVQGPSDLVTRFQTANPDFFRKKKDSPYKVSMRQTEDGSSFNVDFGDMTAGEIKEIAPQLEEMKKAYGSLSRSDLSGAGAATGGTAGTAKPIAKGPAAGEGESMVGRSSGKARSGAAAAIASQPQAEPEPQVLGPMSPEQEFAAINRKLAEIESRGGASAYGARQTLTTPFYTDVASELNVQPEQVGASVYQRTPRTVVSQNFPVEQFRNLPQEVQNRLYIDAMNKSAQAMQQARYKPSGKYSEYQMNDPWIGSMFDKLSR